MQYKNHIKIQGFVSNDPDLRPMGTTGVNVITIKVATKYSRKNRHTGEWTTEEEFHTCQLSGDEANIASQLYRKGDPIYVEGRVKSRKWTDSKGYDRTVYEIMVEDHHRLDDRMKPSQLAALKAQALATTADHTRVNFTSPDASMPKPESERTPSQPFPQKRTNVPF